jgi:hypothetical protein
VATTVDEAAPARSARVVLPAILFPIAVFVVWRVGTAIITTQAFNNSWMEPTLRWDSGNYMLLTNKGYFEATEFQPVTAFFPFVAWCAKAVRVLGFSDLWAYTIVVNTAALGAFVAVWGAVREWRDEAVARWTVGLLALFPASFFLWSFYSEAAFVALSAGAVWADRKNKHWLTVVLLAAVASTRTIGILVAVILVVCRLWRERKVDRVAVLYAVGGAAGLALVMGQMWYQMGDPFDWLKVQNDWGREMTPPWETIDNGWRSIPDSTIFPEQPKTEYKAKILDFVSVWLVLFAAAWAAWPRRDRERRWPPEAWLLILGLALLPLSSKLLYSFNRFALADWVIFAVYAEILVLATRRWKVAWVPVGAVLIFAAIMSYQFVGHWVRYNFVG